ncbi:hypothetical protein TUMEXPCC7403_10345 [Tumidithrix helvetica PCC 7403]|uniref:beta strand repeat-containing protein n=1 Tax=Tumidithrix helvetica TaxID=3457545 RepID=UPI003C9D7798
MATVNGTSGNDTFRLGTNPALFQYQPGDILVGGAGNDSYLLQDTATIVKELNGGGFDTVFWNGAAGSTYTATPFVDRVVLQGTANTNATASYTGTTLQGNAGNNILTGSAGNDIFYDFDGGTDVFQGGNGNDTYFINHTGISVFETAGGGNDSIRAYVSVDLSVTDAEIETIVLDNAAGAADITGSSSNNVITGNSSVNNLLGGGGNDTLDGGSDSVADIMDGGNGSDTYNVRPGQFDTIVDTGVSGTDTIIAAIAPGDTIDIGTAQYQGIENVTLGGNLTGPGSNNGAPNSNVTGNAAVNVLKGNGGDNIITAVGAGDTLFGLAGDDTFVINNASVQIFENAGVGWGIDTIQSSVSFNLQYASNVENLTLTGASNIDGQGNGSSNVITGNSGNNLLTASTGAADGQADTLQGAGGNDTYYVYEDFNLDIVIDTVGTNTIYAFSNYDMGGTTADLVDIRLQGTNIIAGGTSAINTISGNAQNNTLRGYGGNDKIFGGAGNDTIDGGTGNDILSGNNLGATSATEQDTITGGIGADTFVLGFGSNVFYLGGGANDFTAVQDFNPTSEGDRIQLAGGPSAAYTLNNLGGGSYDLLRTTGADLIAKITVTDGSTLTLSSSFFVAG